MGGSSVRRPALFVSVDLAERNPDTAPNLHEGDLLPPEQKPDLFAGKSPAPGELVQGKCPDQVGIAPPGLGLHGGHGCCSSGRGPGWC